MDFFTSYIPDPVGVILETGFHQFRHSSGMEGLAKIEAGALEILAVLATRPGHGQFRAFINACKANFLTVTVWEDWNPIIGQALSRYGFSPTSKTDDGEILTGWRWNATNPIAP